MKLRHAKVLVVTALLGAAPAEASSPASLATLPAADQLFHTPDLDHPPHAFDVHSVAADFSALDARGVALAGFEALFAGRALRGFPDLAVRHAKQPKALEAVSRTLYLHHYLVDTLFRATRTNLLGAEAGLGDGLFRGRITSGTQLSLQTGDVLGRLLRMPGTTTSDRIRCG